MHLLAFDETVFAKVRIDPNARNSLCNVPLRGGGGTDFQDLFNKVALLRPSIAVILTDLDVTLPPAPKFPLLWAVPHAVTLPHYSQVIRIRDTR